MWDKYKWDNDRGCKSECQIVAQPKLISLLSHQSNKLFFTVVRNKCCCCCCFNVSLWFSKSKDTITDHPLLLHVGEGGVMGWGIRNKRRKRSHAFVHAEQQLQAQSDACVPSEGEDADVASHDGRTQEVLHRGGAVGVAIKHLRRGRRARSAWSLAVIHTYDPWTVWANHRQDVSSDRIQ